MFIIFTFSKDYRTGLRVVVQYLNLMWPFVVTEGLGCPLIDPHPLINSRCYNTLTHVLTYAHAGGGGAGGNFSLIVIGPYSVTFVVNNVSVSGGDICRRRTTQAKILKYIILLLVDSA